MSRSALAVIAVIAILAVATAADPLVDGLATDDPSALAHAVAAIEAAPTSPGLAPALLAAARACETRLHDPVRARALYARIGRELPDASGALVAQRRIAVLDAELGPHGEHAREAAALSELVASADQLAPDVVIARGEELSTEPWPGAADAALWLAAWQRRSGRPRDAEQRYATAAARWPDSMQALRGEAGCALDLHDWDGAEALARQLPDAATADELLRAAARGRTRDHWYLAAWLGLALAVLALLASLIEATVRGGVRWPAWQPPIEILFLGPVTAVLIAIAVTAHRAIAPAVATISLGGLALAWLSGASLELARTRGRSVRARAIIHVLACLAGVVALGYIAMTRDGLVDLLAETVRFGPEGT